MSRNWLVEQINKFIENNMKPLEAKKKKIMQRNMES